MNLKNNPIIQNYIASNAFGRFLGMDFEIPEAGEVVYSITIQSQHLATPLAAHGGVIASLMDGVLGVACLSKVCTEGKIVSTVTLSINYLAPAFENDILTAKAKVIKAGKRILFVDGTIVNQDNVLIATGNAVMNAYEVR